MWHSNRILLFLHFLAGTTVSFPANIFEDLTRKICPHQTNIQTNPHDIVALILARGGSKGIPLKNLVKVNGLSLLAKSILVSKNANVFSEIWVSTDDQRIAWEAERYGAHIHYRPSHLAADKTPSIDAVLEFIQGHRHIQNVALIQCTSIFISESYLEAAAAMFQLPDVDCVFSAVRSWKLRWTLASDGQLTALNFDTRNRPRRQDWNGEIIEGGMFYFARRRLIEVSGAFQNDRCKAIEIDEQDALEIDTVFHLKLAEALTRID